MQATVLALIIDWALALNRKRGAIVRVMVMALAFFWMSHVIGDVAKCGFPPKNSCVALETLYLAIQFVAFGRLIWLGHMVWDRSVKNQYPYEKEELNPCYIQS